MVWLSSYVYYIIRLAPGKEAATGAKERSALPWLSPGKALRNSPTQSPPPVGASVGLGPMGGGAGADGSGAGVNAPADNPVTPTDGRLKVLFVSLVSNTSPQGLAMSL